MPAGRLESINRSRGGVPKAPVFEALVTVAGLDGDHQRDPQFHGGPDRAVVLYSLEVIRALQLEGHPIAVGASGENLTMSGVDWTAIVPGVELEIGGARLAVTKYVTPCTKIAGCFVEDRFERIAQKCHPGWSRVAARVLAEGVVRVGDRVVVHAPVPPAAASHTNS